MNNQRTIPDRIPDIVTREGIKLWQEKDHIVMQIQLKDGQELIYAEEVKSSDSVHQTMINANAAFVAMFIKTYGK